MSFGSFFWLIRDPFCDGASGFVMYKAAARNFSTSKYKALCRMGLCSGLASSNSNRAALSVYTWTASGGVNGSGPEGVAGNVPSWVHINQTCCKYG